MFFVHRSFISSHCMLYITAHYVSYYFNIVCERLSHSIKRLLTYLLEIWKLLVAFMAAEASGESCLMHHNCGENLTAIFISMFDLYVDI